MLVLFIATFFNLFATVFNGLIIARILFGLALTPENRFQRGLINLTEPILAPIRRVIPAPGGLDFSPTAAVILLYFISVIAGALLGGQ